jgi:NADH-quinone oxidoreductase subunit I
MAVRGETGHGAPAGTRRCERAAARGPAADFLCGFVSVFRGMVVTLKNLVLREKITVKFPYERVQVSERYRGLFYLPFDEEAGRLKCVGCTLCAQACPTNVITMTKLGTGKHAGVSAFTMDLGRCMFCNLCVEACPFDAIHMGQDYVLASPRRDASLFPIEDLTPGGRAAVERNNRTIQVALAAEADAKAATGKDAAGSHAAPAARAQAREEAST